MHSKYLTCDKQKLSRWVEIHLFINRKSKDSMAVCRNKSLMGALQLQQPIQSHFYITVKVTAKVKKTLNY